MFQGSEIFVILLVALVVLGPERLPGLARKLGGWTAELRKAARELRAGLESELGDVGAIVDDVRSPINEMKQAAREATGEVRKVGSEAKRDFDEAAGEARSPSSWVGPKPISGPTPADAMADLESIERTGRPLDDAPEPSGEDELPGEATG